MNKIMAIKGFENYTIDENGIVRNLKGKEICKWIDNVGYLQVKLFKNGNKFYKRVHRLVAEAFLPNPNNFKQVNHINGDKTNNKLENLEWINNSMNTQHGYNKNLYHSKKRSIQIEVYTKENKYICTYKSIRETAEALNINRKTLSSILFNNKINNYNYNFKALI